MNTYLRGAVLAGALGRGAFAGVGEGVAQQKDLNVEVAPSHQRPTRLRPHVFRPMQVSLQTIGSPVISIGQPLRFRMVSLSDGYGQLYVLSASGRTQLWLENVRLRAGLPITYPRPGLIVRAAPPAGDETLLFIATRAPLEGFVGGTSGTPFDLQYTHDGLRAAVQQKLDAMPRSEWAIGELNVRVQE